MEKENKEDKEVIKIKIPKFLSGITPKLRKNPWIVSTFVLLILALVLLINGSGGGITGEVISENDAGQTVLALVSAQASDAQLLEVNIVSGLYEVILSIEGEETPVYLTLDGENLVSNLMPVSLLRGFLSEQETQQDVGPSNVPKADIPVIELFIWSYCPYGVQAQGPLADVVSLLGENADFEVVLYYDGHGAYETQQNKIQACIQEIAPDKYWQYASSFVKDIYPECGSLRDVECDKTESVKLMKSLGIDDLEVMSCVDERGEDLIAEYSSRASAYGVTGSPSLIINGVKVSTARNSEAFKTAICEAFNEVPEECSRVLDSSNTNTASGNC